MSRTLYQGGALTVRSIFGGQWRGRVVVIDTGVGDHVEIDRDSVRALVRVLTDWLAEGNVPTAGAP